MWEFDGVNRFGGHEYKNDKNPNWRVHWYPKDKMAQALYNTCRGYQLVKRTRRTYTFRSPDQAASANIPEYVKTFIIQLWKSSP